jgi:hypothetical protein
MLAGPDMTEMRAQIADHMIRAAVVITGFMQASDWIGIWHISPSSGFMLNHGIPACSPAAGCYPGLANFFGGMWPPVFPALLHFPQAACGLLHFSVGRRPPAFWGHS